MTTFESKMTWRPSAPVNLRESSRPLEQVGTLTQAVQAAVRDIDDNTLRLVARRDAGLAYQPKALLALLTYCYAREIYGSEAVEDVMRRDDNFRRLCHDEFPGARLIRRFRRDNREPLRLCLISVLRFLALQKLQAGVVTNVKDAHLVEEANRRIIMAMFIDNMDLDSD